VTPTTDTVTAVNRRPRNRQTAIVSAAAALFADRGFAATRIDDIGAQVGVTGPAIYRHFKSKDALLAAVVMDTLAAFAVRDDGAGAALERVLNDAVGVALDDPARLATYIRERHRLAGDAREQYVRAERRLYRAWRSAIRAANPSLDDKTTATRQFAVLTAMSAVAVRPPVLGRTQLVHLLVEAMMSVLEVPAGPAPTRTSLRGAWAPPTTRRQEILTQALRLFRQRGYDGVGIDEIGEAAGISGPSVYFHYDTKAAILVDAYEQAGSRVVAGIHDAIALATSATEALERLAASYLEIAHDNGDLIVVTNREGAAIPPPDRPRFARRRRDVLGTWVTVLRQLRPDMEEAKARALVAGVIALMGQLAQEPGNADRFVPLARAWCLGLEGC